VIRVPNGGFNNAGTTKPGWSSSVALHKSAGADRALKEIPTNSLEYNGFRDWLFHKIPPEKKPSSYTDRIIRHDNVATELHG